MEGESIESTEMYVKLLGWLHANRKKLVIATGVAAVIAVIIGIVYWQKAEAEDNAGEKLMGVPLTSFSDGHVVPTPATPFLDLGRQYPDTSAGAYAALLGAEALFTEEKFPEAHEAFSRFINDYPDNPFLAQAKIGVAASLEGEGKISESAQKYQEVISSYSAEPYIVSPAKLTLARLYEQLNKPEQAFTEYEDLARVNNPYDPWISEARERIQALLVKHPELRKATAPASAAPPGAHGGSFSFPNPQSTPAPVSKKP